MFFPRFVCFKCKKHFPLNPIIFECPNDGYSLDIEYDYNFIKNKINHRFFYSTPVSHWKYYAFYPIKDLKNIVSMQEGNTPLIRSTKYKNVMFKYEGVNPTGVFKDRGTSVEISKAKELNVKKIVCASTGNMGASVAAYSSKAKIKATIFVPSFAEQVKLKQMKFYGAEVKSFKGTYNQVLEKTKKLRKKTGIFLTGDYSFRGEGQKSVGFEIIDQLNYDIPKNIVVPMGNGTLIYAIYKACLEFQKTGFIRKIPKIIGIQAQGCNPIVQAFKNGWKEVKPAKKTKTIASAINCDNPINGLEALHAINKSKGFAGSVTDKQIKDAKIELGKEGIYAETSSASTYAAIKKFNLTSEKTVAVITGHGLKEF